MNFYEYEQRRHKPKVVSVLLLGFVSILIGVLSSLYAITFMYLGIMIFAIVFLLFLLFNQTERTVVMLSVLLIVSLFLIPGFTIAGTGFRLDDGIVVFLTLFLAYMFFKESSYIKSPINKWIYIYVTYMLSITFIQIALGNSSMTYILFSIKEVQYFIYFFAFLFVMKNDWFRSNFVKIFMWLSIITMLWGCYQLLFDASVGFYGIGLISETASSQSGGVFFLISVFFLYLINSKSRIIPRITYFVLFMILVGMVFATVSRTAILALSVVYAVYLLFTLFRMSVKRIAIWLYLIIPIIPVIYFILQEDITYIFARLQGIDAGANTRTEKWDYLLSHGSDMGFIFGEGRGFVQTITGGFTLATDSQYVRNIMELGFIGTTLFIFIMFSIITFAYKNMKTNYGESLFLILITIGFLVMSVTHEVFLVTIQASFYWMLVGAFVGKIIHDKKNKGDLVIT